MKIKIDPRKVSLSEKDLEDWLYENPTSLTLLGRPVVSEWVGRQFRVPSGIIDLLGVYPNLGTPVIVEMKNTTAVRPEYLTQIIRYKHDIQEILAYTEDEKYSEDFQVLTYLVGPFESMGSEQLFEANALNINIVSLEYWLEASLSGTWSFNDKYKDEIENKIVSACDSESIKKIRSYLFASEVARNILQKNRDDDELGLNSEEPGAE